MLDDQRPASACLEISLLSHVSPSAFTPVFVKNNLANALLQEMLFLPSGVTSSAGAAGGTGGPRIQQIRLNLWVQTAVSGKYTFINLLRGTSNECREGDGISAVHRGASRADEQTRKTTHVPGIPSN